MPTTTSVTKTSIRAAVKAAFALRCVSHAFHTDIVGQALPIIKRGTMIFEVSRNGKPFRMDLNDIQPISATQFDTYTMKRIDGVLQRALCGRWEIIAAEPTTVAS